MAEWIWPTICSLPIPILEQATLIYGETAMKFVTLGVETGEWKGSCWDFFFFLSVWLLIMLLCSLYGNSSFCALTMCTLFCVILFLGVKFALEAASKQMN